MDLDYVIPRAAVLPFSKTELNLLLFKRPDESKASQTTDTRKRTTSEIIEGIQW